MLQALIHHHCPIDCDKNVSPLSLIVNLVGATSVSLPDKSFLASLEVEKWRWIQKQAKVGP